MVFWNRENSRRREESHQPIVCGEKRPKAFPCLLRLLRALLHLNPTVYSFGRVRGFCHSMSLNLAGVTIITINKNIAISLLIEPQLTESFSCCCISPFAQHFTKKSKQQISQGLPKGWWSWWALWVSLLLTAGSLKQVSTCWDGLGFIWATRAHFFFKIHTAAHILLICKPPP